MLEVSGTLVKDCPAVQNVATLRENGVRRMPTLGGWKSEPKWEPIYTDGLLFGALSPVAPIALKAGDVLVVDGSTGEAMRVERGGEIIWEKVKEDGAVDEKPKRKRAT